VAGVDGGRLAPSPRWGGGAPERWTVRRGWLRFYTLNDCRGTYVRVTHPTAFAVPATHNPFTFLNFLISMISKNAEKSR
jgi:hypothetical protein